MTNKEWYKRAFSSLHTSPDFMVQLENRKTAKWSKKWAFAGGIHGPDHRNFDHLCSKYWQHTKNDSNMDAWRIDGCNVDNR